MEVSERPTVRGHRAKLFWICASALIVVVSLGAVGVSAANPPGGAPSWFPLRGDHLIGCTYNSPGTVCGGNYHPYWAIDMKGAKGDPIYAAGKGTVANAVTNQGNNCSTAIYKNYNSCPNGSRGNSVLVDHGSGVFSYYQHMVTVAVKAGDPVDENTVIGAVGDSGWSTPGFYHLHFERRTVNGTKVDPGPLKGCSGTTLKTYPQEFGAAYSSWQGLPGHKFTAHSDGTACVVPPGGGGGGGGGGKPKVDLVFAIDTTGSMTPYIAGVQASAHQIASALFTNADARVALVDYKDLYQACGSDGYAARVDLPFSTSPAAFDAAVNTLTATGGCDFPESVYSGLMAAIALPWRNGVKKAIIIMGDAPPHDPEPVTGFTLSSVTAAAIAVDPASIYAININGGGSPYFEDLAAQNGGQTYIASDPSTAVEQISNAIVTITASGIVANVGGPYLGVVGDSVTFDASTSTASDANIINYEWDFDGNGSYDTTTSLPTVSHVYASPYNGFIGLRITTDDTTPRTATATGAVRILIPARLKYTGERGGNSGNPVHLQAFLTDPAGVPVVGAKVTFALGTETCTAYTDAYGKANCKVTAPATGSYLVVADAETSPPYFRSGDSAIFNVVGR
jgi:hypothetical protein